MKEVCKEVKMSYETLKYYCNEGLLPNVKRDNRNYRIFDDKDIAWLKSLSCLKKCGMSINEMKQYIDLCFKGETSIMQRKEILSSKKEDLLRKLQDIQDCITYIDTKQHFYDDVLDKKTPYISNLIDVKQKN